MTDEERDVQIQILTQRLADVEERSIVFNNSIIAIGLLSGYKKGSFKYITPDDYKEFLLKDMQPFVDNIMNVATKANTLIKEEQDAKRNYQETKHEKGHGGEVSTSKEDDTSGGDSEPQG